MHLSQLRWLIIPLLMAALTVPGATTGAVSQDVASEQPTQTGTPITMTCPFDSPLDRLSRGFYVENFSGNRLDSVTTQYDARSTGTFEIQMIARNDNYGGSVIGSATVTFNYTDTNADMQQTFNFGGAVVNSSRITFEQVLVSGPTSLIFYDGGQGPCPNFTKTDGTTPPLDTFRDNKVGAIVKGRMVQENQPAPQPVPGCRVEMTIPSQAVGGLFVADAQLYWSPGQLVAPETTITAGNTARVLGMDQSRQFYQIIWNCQKLWVPVGTMGPNPDAVWQGAPLPTSIVE